MADSTASTARTKKQSAAERKQNRRIQQLIAKTATLTTDLTTLDTKVSGIDTRLAAIEGAAPVIIDGLGKLKTGLETAGAGLTKLGDAYQAVEYGVAKVSANNVSAAAGSSMTSADIPDDGNAVTTNEDAIMVATANTTITIDLRAVIRSAESDGDDASKTAGQAGGFVQVSNLATGASMPCAGAPNPPGITGTLAGDSIVTPSGTVTNLPLKNIPGGILRTDTTHPDGSSTALLPPPGCVLPGVTAGTPMRVHYSVNFVDIPTSTTPGPKE
jgi:hypothetical protein